jgi:hypothetical protein
MLLEGLASIRPVPALLAVVVTWLQEDGFAGMFEIFLDQRLA